MRRLSPAERERITAQATDLMGALECGTRDDPSNRSAVYSQPGHKGDLLMIHFRESIVGLNRVELALAQMELYDFLEAQSSYLSVVELGLYESSTKTYAALAAEGHEPHTAEWESAVERLAKRQARAMAGRLRPAIPDATYICFYPLDRRRGEQLNSYTGPMAERQRLMHEHCTLGRQSQSSHPIEPVIICRTLPA